MLKNLITNVSEVSKATRLSRVTIYAAVNGSPSTTLKTINKILLYFGKKLIMEDEYGLKPLIVKTMLDMKDEKLRKALNLDGNLKFSELEKIADYQKWELILENCDRPQTIHLH